MKKNWYWIVIVVCMVLYKAFTLFGGLGSLTKWTPDTNGGCINHGRGYEFLEEFDYPLRDKDRIVSESFYGQMKVYHKSVTSPSELERLISDYEIKLDSAGFTALTPNQIKDKADFKRIKPFDNQSGLNDGDTYCYHYLRDTLVVTLNFTVDGKKVFMKPNTAISRILPDDYDERVASVQLKILKMLQLLKASPDAVDTLNTYIDKYLDNRVSSVTSAASVAPCSITVPELGEGKRFPVFNAGLFLRGSKWEDDSASVEDVIMMHGILKQHRYVGVYYPYSLQFPQKDMNSATFTSGYQLGAFFILDLEENVSLCQNVYMGKSSKSVTDDVNGFGFEISADYIENCVSAVRKAVDKLGIEASPEIYRYEYKDTDFRLQETKNYSEVMLGNKS